MLKRKHDTRASEQQGVLDPPKLAPDALKKC